MQRKALALFTVIMLWAGAMNAQDPHFSQFNASPLLLNPALTGFYNGDYRITANFRSQWGSFTDNYRTVAAAFEMSILKGRLRDDNLAFGLMFYNDAAGTARFGRNNIGVSAAYKKALGKGRVKHTLTIGAQGSLLSHNIDVDKLTFDNQYNGIEFDPNMPSGVVVSSGSMGADVNVGVLYQVIPSEYLNFYFGGAYSHIFGPEVSVIDGSSYKLQPKYTFHAGLYAELNNYLNILPSVVFYQQGAARQINAGGYVQFIFDYLNDAETAFAVGTWVRVSDPQVDAAIIAARLDFQHFTLGTSYDLNVSKLKEVSQSRGAYEISLMYTGSFVTKGKRKMMIPCPQL